MPRKPSVLQSEFPYHVCARSINREWFNLPMDQVWEIMSNQLYFVHTAYNVRILAFILMSNHFHLIVQTPDCNLSEAMAWFMRESSRELTRSGNRINQAYGGRYFRSIISSEHYYGLAYKYLYTNSLRAGQARRVENYQFSALRGLLGLRRLGFPVAEDRMLFSNVEATLEWLNLDVKGEHHEAVRKALRRSNFKLTLKKGEPHELETRLL